MHSIIPVNKNLHIMKNIKEKFSITLYELSQNTLFAMGVILIIILVLSFIIK